MKIMAATFNGVAPSRDDYEDDAEYQSLCKLCPIT